MIILSVILICAVAYLAYELHKSKKQSLPPKELEDALKELQKQKASLEEQIIENQNTASQWTSVKDLGLAKQKMDEDLQSLQKQKDLLESQIKDVQKSVSQWMSVKDLDYTRQKLEEQLRIIEKRQTDKKLELETTQRILSSLDNEMELAQSGIIKLNYNFGTSDEYDKKLDLIRETQKEMVKNKNAIKCDKEWVVGGSKAEGKKMIDRLVKLGLNAFNYQSDNIILNVKYSNYDRSKEKILKLKETIEKLLEVNECYLNTEYLKLKYDELELVFGYQEKLYEEKEEQKRIRLQMQEEEKVRREIEKARLEAEKEELFFEKALDRARKEVEKKSGEEQEKLMSKIQEMEQQLKEAHEKKERAISQAELTRRGHVYVISNIGSFGENVYKIGMTRRWEPMDRIDELGDASVPFDFDVHAMIFSEDAPALEKSLHNYFTSQRTNQINMRKEFFNIGIHEIEAACISMKVEAKLTKIAEAKEYRQTIIKKDEKKAA